MAKTIFFLATIISIALVTAWLDKPGNAFAGPCNPQQQQC
jgi:hypothetical protein